VESNTSQNVRLVAMTSPPYVMLLFVDRLFRDADHAYAEHGPIN